MEALLLNHPKVRDVGVVGLPDEVCGELPVAFVVSKEGQDVTENELQQYISGTKKTSKEIAFFRSIVYYFLFLFLGLVSPQKWLRGGVIFVDEIPKNPSGKILRRELRDKLKDYKKKPKSKL